MDLCLLIITDQDVCVAGQKKLAAMFDDIEKSRLVEHLCLQFFPLFIFLIFFHVNTSSPFLIP